MPIVRQLRPTSPASLRLKTTLQRLIRAGVGALGRLSTGAGSEGLQPVSQQRRSADRPRFPVLPGPPVVPPVTYRPYRSGDERSIIRGFNEVFRLSRDTAYWRWKFCRQEPPLAMLAVDAAGSVQAQFAGVRGSWEGSDGPLPVAQICDLFSRRHPWVVRGNVMLRTMEAFHTHYARDGGVALLYGFPNRTALRLHGNLRPSFESVQPVSTYRRNVSGHRALGIPDRVSTAVPDREALDVLWNEAGRRYRRATPRNGDWLYWRFRDRPDVQDYRYLSCVRADGALSAWMVLRCDGGVLWICDLVWDGLERCDLSKLDAAADMAAVCSGAGELGIWLHGDREAASALRQLGWADRTREQQIRLAMHPYQSAIDLDAVHDGLYLTMADSDLI